MSGAWACEACATRLGLGEGEGRAASLRGGWCAVGAHESEDPVRWFEDAPNCGRRSDLTRLEPASSVLMKPQQLDLLEAP